MRQTFLFTLLLAIASAAQAQVVISPNRPAASTTLAPLPVAVDTVFLVVNNQVVTGIRKEQTFKCIYEQSGRHEGNVFAGIPEFFAADKRGGFTVPVTPTAWRYKKSVFSSEQPWNYEVREAEPVRQ